MARRISIQDLRDATTSVLSELEAGERLTLTIDQRPIADIVPRVEERSPWVSSSELRRIVCDTPADHGLLHDLADIRRPSSSH
jgi:antitoxin (DNA-binding transcriptional repressor) of toxin-antitoxin stability system